MKPPIATYRLQLRNGLDFDGAIPVVRYLKELGISHVYASPIFQARSGSTHGYDVTTYHRLDESLGGLAGFRRLSDELRSLGLKLILDIVPNHMAALPENRWWRDVLRHGRDSVYAGFFDIDWSQDRLLLPVLGRSFEEALAEGEISLGHEDGRPTLRYFDQTFPLDPKSWRLLFPEPPDDAPGRLEQLSKDRGLMMRLHEAQRYRLVYWRQARDQLGYRRFFEISDLVGVRVEEEVVFDSVHSFVFELVRMGLVHGLRVDHLDGLADPAKYLSDLQRKLPRPVPVWIEKILAADECLPAAWDTVGATGYEFAAMAGRLLANGDGTGVLDSVYRSYAAASASYEEMVGSAKAEILTRNLEAELNALARFAAEALGDDADHERLRAGIVALMSALPVYRTYFTATDASEVDLKLLDEAVASAKRSPGADAPTIDALAGLLRGASAADRFRTRFQQTSAALEAKAVEDTVFYRFNRLVSDNEVGADPATPSMSVEAFHERMAERAAHEPLALNATATHDTKRGEDARMRIAAIAEAPHEWATAVESFDELLGGRRDRCDPNMRWLFYQSLLGAWTGPDDDALVERMGEFLLKAAREAKQHTSWVDRDDPYEAGLSDFVEGTLSDATFRAAFDRAAVPFIRIGERKSLVQLGLKLFAPGIPDIYQGTEFADLSLVDPDNRRPVDFDARSGAPREGANISAFDRRKSELLRLALNARRRWPELFGSDYRPVRGPAGVIAFKREHGKRVLHFAAELTGTASAPFQPVDGVVLATYPEDEDDIGVRISIVEGD